MAKLRVSAQYLRRSLRFFEVPYRDSLIRELGGTQGTGLSVCFSTHP